ncbi:Trichodiene synthase-domain-containing protein [Lenzites betulinus]|nr:Trichodiene synthase-domain-containing protein [Lenzites betulinus]
MVEHTLGSEPPSPWPILPMQAITVARSAVSSLVTRLTPHHSWRDIRFDPDGSVERRVRSIVAGWAPEVTALRRFEPGLVSSVDIVTSCYNHVPLDVKVHIALYNTLAILTDDSEIESAALDAFMERFYSCTPQQHRHLDHMVDILRRMPDYFSSYGAKTIIQGTVEFINVNALESTTQHLPLSPDAMGYVTARRMKNGVADPYAAFIFPKADFPDATTWIQALPEMAVFIDWANDVFSFYKEELDHETHTFVHERALITGKTVGEVLSELVDEAVIACDRVRAILQGEKERQVWESFLAGYVAWHRFTPRYRLDEVFGSTGKCAEEREGWRASEASREGSKL